MSETVSVEVELRIAQQQNQSLQCRIDSLTGKLSKALAAQSEHIEENIRLQHSWRSSYAILEEKNNTAVKENESLKAFRLALSEELSQYRLSNSELEEQIKSANALLSETQLNATLDKGRVLQRLEEAEKQLKYVLAREEEADRVRVVTMEALAEKEKHLDLAKQQRLKAEDNLQVLRCEWDTEKRAITDSQARTLQDLNDLLHKMRKSQQKLEAGLEEEKVRSLAAENRCLELQNLLVEKDTAVRAKSEALADCEQKLGRAIAERDVVQDKLVRVMEMWGKQKEALLESINIYSAAMHNK